ncbi:hypothetical protein [Nocardioides pacificus]
MARVGKVSAAAVAALLVLVTGGCGDDSEEADEPTTSSSSPSAPSSESAPSTGSPSADAPEGTVIEVTIADGEVSPSGDRVEAALGEPVVFAISSDVAGEMHVHSTPEQEIAFEAGTSEHEITVDTPGVVEVELHDPALTVVQLEVS